MSASDQADEPLGRDAESKLQPGITVSKDDYDIARLFLMYLAFAGNVKKTSIATGIAPEAIDILAAKEDWPGKLEVYQTLRHDERQCRTEAALCRTAAFITAYHLRDLIRRLLDRLHSIGDDDQLIASLSAYDPRTNRLKLRSRAIGDLTRACYLAEKILARGTRSSCAGNPFEEPETEEARSLREAVWRALDAADHVPGVDAVALMRDSHDIWKTAKQEGADDD